MPHPLLVASAVTSGLAIGFVPTLVDSLRPALQKRLNLSEARVEYGLRLFYVFWLPGMPLAGWLLDRSSNKEILFFGLLATVLGIAWLALAQSLRSFLGAVVTLGLAYCAVATAGIRLMPAAFAFSAESSTVATLNVGFVFVALGAVVGPWVVARLERFWGYRQGLLYLSFAFIVPAGLVTFAAKADFPAPEGSALQAADVLGNVRLGLLGLIILLYFALENCLEVWPEPYLQELGYRDRGLTVALAVFWGAFVLLRLATGWLPGNGYEPWVLLGLTLASAFIMGNLVGAQEYSSGSLGFWMTAACYGPLLPGFLGLVLDVSHPLSGTALGLMLALSGLDTVLVRPVMISLARRRPARSVMLVPTVLAVVMAAPLLILALIAGQ